MKKVYGFVPLQEFDKLYKDSELYEKYMLSEKEIRFIEESIKTEE
jgi:hypothetical protein